MAGDVIRAVTGLLSTCSRRVSRAARKLRGPRHLSRQLKVLASSKQFFPRRVVAPFTGGEIGGDELAVEEEEEEEEVWRRGIIMGEKCQPLDFSGVIYYDVDGRQMAVAPAPKSPMRSPLRLLLAEEKRLEGKWEMA